MTVSLGSDHAGFELKERIKEYLNEAGFRVIDVGTNSAESTDYPEYALRVARSVAGGSSERGILVCYTGIGMSIAANKVSGIRAALCTTPSMAEMSRRHNDANVLTLGAGQTDADLAREIVRIFLETPPDEAERHRRRVRMIHDTTER